MKPFTTHTGVVASLNRADIDTDQIVPKEFLKRVERSGFGRFLFHDWRFDEAGAERMDFALNRPDGAGASILVTGRNFGCGSSREHAAWALEDFGFRAIIAPSFADIFRENADQNGLLTVSLDEELVSALAERAARDEPYTLTIDLETCSLRDDEGFQAIFPIEGYRRRCLLEGFDRIDLTLRHEEAIAAFEARIARDPW